MMKRGGLLRGENGVKKNFKKIRSEKKCGVAIYYIKKTNNWKCDRDCN